MQVKLLGHCDQETINSQLQIVASAGRLSRTKGKVTQVYETSTDYESNIKMIKNVIGFGHETISEHDYLVFALEDVTPIIEQTIISYRLSSFTIKSRREGDFTNEGFYLPTFRNENGEVMPNNAELQKLYSQHAQNLFDSYHYFINNGIPFEDARYILPYSFHANIIMGMNAHELKRLVDSLLNGKLSHISELQELGMKLKEIIDYRAPYLKKFIENSKTDFTDNLNFLDDEYQSTTKNSILNKPNLINVTSDGDRVVAITALAARYQLSYNDASQALEQLEQKDPAICQKIIKGVMNNAANRELESVIYQFEFPSSLAVLTHFTRHRMHSMLIPDFVPIWDLTRVKTPKSIADFDLPKFQQLIDENIELYNYFKEQGVCEEDLVYFYLSANIANILTTINARSLKWMSALRTCKKTQWETREIFLEMAKQAKEKTPLLGEYYGPNCEVYGVCKEGKDSCKNRGVQKLELKPTNK